MGVLLALEDDPKKAFSASRSGEVFGVHYCTLTFTWWLGEDKLSVIIDMLMKVEKTDQHTLGFMKQITGKLVHYRLMVPQGKYHLGQLIRSTLCRAGEDMSKMVTVSEWARAEAWYWRCLLPFCGHRVRIPDPSYELPPWTLHAYTDAAGGTTTSMGRGLGAVIEPSWWCYLPWGSIINSTRRFEDGVCYKDKMSAWELLGPLLVLTAGVEMVKNRSLIVPVDNAGSVAIYRKGWCT